MKKKLRMIAGGVALITAFAGAAYMPSSVLDTGDWDRSAETDSYLFQGTGKRQGPDGRTFRRTKLFSMCGGKPVI